MKEKCTSPKPQLKEIIDTDAILQSGHTKICILAGVGAGKSTWVEEVLATKGNVLWVTSRRIPVEQVTSKKQSVFSKKHRPEINNNQTHVTNAQLEGIVRDCMEKDRSNLDEFISCYDFVVVDEAHSLVADRGETYWYFKRI